MKGEERMIKKKRSTFEDGRFLEAVESFETSSSAVKRILLLALNLCLHPETFVQKSRTELLIR